jgi:hypothetical protein
MRRFLLPSQPTSAPKRQRAIESWLRLREKKNDIAEGWRRIGWSQMLDKDYQIKALTTLNKEDPIAAAAAAAEVEEEPETHEYDEQEDEKEEVTEGDEDEATEVVLARCIENAGVSSNNRRSTRHSYRDANLARALQEQTYDEICNLD